MTGVLTIKFLLLSIVWTLGWLVRFIHTNQDTTPKAMGVLFAPWLLMVTYITLFWWG